MRFEPLAQSATIVMVGSFNPAIFSPSWLALHKVIAPEDVEGAEIALIHPQISEFSVNEFKVTVEPDMFRIQILSEPFIVGVDVVANIFLGLLKHTPIQQVGINYDIHFALSSNKQRSALGRALAPTAPWGEWGGRLDAEKQEDAGGLRNLVMEEPRPDGRASGYKRVHIQPSVREDIVNTTVGVYMLINDHFEATSVEGAASAQVCTQWAVDNFDASISASKRIVSDIMDYAEKL